jgi:hypothetical protein
MKKKGKIPAPIEKKGAGREDVLQYGSRIP